MSYSMDSEQFKSTQKINNYTNFIILLWIYTNCHNINDKINVKV